MCEYYGVQYGYCGLPQKTPAIHAIMLYNTDIRSYERQQRQHQVLMIIIQVSKVEAARIGEKENRGIGRY